VHWSLVHVGGGPLRDTLQQQARALGLADRIAWRGAMAQDQLIEEYRRADVFVLASRIAGDGDRDGLPNVLMEAQSQGLACVATNVSAIPELIDDGVTGVLVEPQLPSLLADALASVITDPARRQTLAQAGQTRMARDFGMQSNLARLAVKFGLRVPPGYVSSGP
jgi:glycosyltransferase involved in cell wall biosynthesis